MWAEQPKGHSFSLCDPRAGHRGAGVAKAVSGPLGCSEGCLLNWGQLGVLMGGGKGQGGCRRAGDQEKGRQPGMACRTWTSVTLRVTGGGGGQEAKKPGPGSSSHAASHGRFETRTLVVSAQILTLP